MTAAAAAGPSDVSPALRAAMQRDLGLSPAQLSQYLKVEDQATRQEKLLARAQGANYAGSWIERKADGSFQLVVATTASGRKAPAGVQVRTVRHTLRDLNASKAQLDFALEQGARVPKGVYGWYVDLPSNTVVVAIGAGQRAAGIDFVARSGADAGAVRFVVESEQPTLRSTLKGGLGYLRNPGDGYLYACSIGFNATRSGSPVFVSAGHCGDAGEPVYLEGSPQWTIGPQIGTFAASNFPQPGHTGNDWSYVNVASGNTQPATVYGWGKGDATVHGSTAAGVGAAICRSGRTSGWQCGTIEATGQTVSYSTGETILNLTRTTACSEGGDSGGSFITGPGQAQGVLSGGSGTCKGKHRSSRSYFQPLLPILSAYNLTLTTN
jgi:streptogrisin C